MTSISAYKRPFGAPSCNPNYTSTFRSPFVSSNCFFSPAVLIWASQRASSFSTSARQFNVSCSMASARRSMAFFLSSRSKFILSRLESKISIGQTLNCTQLIVPRYLRYIPLTYKLVQYWNQNRATTFNRRSEGWVLVGSVRGPRESHGI